MTHSDSDSSRAEANQRKRDVFLEATNILARIEPAYDKLAKVARELNLDVNKFYGYTSQPPRSTPTNEIAQRLYDRWPMPEIYNALKEEFPVQKVSERADVEPIEDRMLADLPELIRRVNQLRSIERRQKEEINSLHRSIERAIVQLKEKRATADAETRDLIDNLLELLGGEFEGNY